MQRRGLEKSFQVQKYVAKPERKGLAEALGLTDAQVKTSSFRRVALMTLKIM